MICPNCNKPIKVMSKAVYEKPPSRALSIEELLDPTEIKVTRVDYCPKCGHEFN
jgi:uncharacterized protein with PIN domain